MEWCTGGHGRIKSWYTCVAMCVYFEEKLFAIFRNLKKKNRETIRTGRIQVVSFDRDSFVN